MDSLPARLAQATPITVSGTWQRHAPARFAHAALEGRSAVGRWGTEGSFPVLYLGRPTDSVVIEAYRHLVDPVDDPAMAAAVRPRVLVTCTVDVAEILDLRSAANRTLAQLTMAQMHSSTRDRAAYTACQNVSAAAHQLGFHGLVAPAATERGDTLVLFTDILPPAEKPIATKEEHWMQLPPDPRHEREGRLRIVRNLI